MAGDGQRYEFQTTCDRSYPLSEIPAAIRYLEQGQVMRIDSNVRRYMVRKFPDEILLISLFGCYMKNFWISAINRLKSL
ncbi:MAG: hypothetical protein KME54_17175 [Tolypothrix brevis GSE-NOS-MK-07-07A]|nr:hypothetical protein [Tolypothrix brevis GSE-NOS-MK-07-07A]